MLVVNRIKPALFNNIEKITHLDHEQPFVGQPEMRPPYHALQRVDVSAGIVRID